MIEVVLAAALAAAPAPRDGEPAPAPLAAAVAELAQAAPGSLPPQASAATEATPAGDGPLTLAAALGRALQANPQIGRARAEIGAADASRRGYLSLILPRLSLSGSLTRNSTEVSFGSDEDRRVLLPENDWNTRLTLQQPVFAGLREQRAYQQSKETLRQAEQGLRVAEDRVLLRTAADYLLLVQAERLVEVERQSLELARGRQKQARDLYEAGEVTQVDVLRADTSVKAAERRVASAIQARENAASLLRLDLDQDVAFQVVEPTDALPPVPGEAELIERAHATRADVAQARGALRIAELEVAKQKGAYLPTIYADAGYVWQKTTFPVDKYGYAALRFNVPLFQSGEVGARVAGARERETQARIGLDEALRGAREDVRRALVELQTARTTEALALEQLQAAEAEYAQVRELYRSQEATSLDAAASEASLAEARRGAVTTRLEAVFAVLRVHFAAGDLKGALLPQIQTRTQTPTQTQEVQ
ncbi:MAG: TolC family protein [Vicinamibacteria bacterium]|nr:TolC family protein [Vicinamibacteria bacterium]